MSLTLTSKIGWKSNVYYGDALGYYAYLPAIFIHDNLDEISTVPSLIPEYVRQGMQQWQYHYSKNAQGEVILQYTYGVALMQFPFFIIAEIVTKLTSAPRDGYTNWYIIMNRVGGYVYVFLGIILLLLWMKKYEVPQRNFLWVSMLLGTNLYWFMVLQAGMAHTYSFFLYALLLWLIERYYSHMKKRDFVGASLCISLLVLIRPVDVLSILPAIFYGVHTTKGIIDRVKYWCKNWALVVRVFLPIVSAAWLPQVAYWYHMTGELLHYSYGAQGFHWTSPEIFGGLFGANNGWITYSPLVLVYLLGAGTNKVLFKWVGWLFVGLYIYVTYAWWNYYYINGFGSRPMIHLYPLLLLWFSVTWQSWSKGIRTFVGMTMVMATMISLVFMYKNFQGTLYSQESKHIFNWSTFFQQELTVSDLVMRDCGIYQPKLKKVEVIHELEMDSVIYVMPDQEYSDFSLEYVVDESTLSFPYMGVLGRFKDDDLVYTEYEQPLLVMTVTRQGHQVDWVGIKINNKIGKDALGQGVLIQNFVVGQWGKLPFYYPTAKLQVGDKVKSFVWNPGKKSLACDRFQLVIGR